VPAVQLRQPYDPSPDAPHARQSPLAYAERMATPVLCLHGEVDIDVPVDCGYAVFRALKSRGVPAALSIYPREPHGVSERAHRVDMAARILAGLGRWLAPPANAAAGAAAQL
jgi:dipeptidyl aminopeptidase/acylaminoacyl peptidase